MHASQTPNIRRYGASAVQKVALIFGIVFMLLGIGGFIPGVTTQYEEMTLFGYTSGAMLMGVFQVSILHNLLHVFFGIAGLVTAGDAKGSRGYLIIGGIVFAGLWAYGSIIVANESENFLPTNAADNLLNLALWVSMLVLGLSLTRHRQEPSAAEARPA